MSNVPKDIHKALGIMLKYKLINEAFNVNEMTSKVESRVGKTTDSAVRYVLGLMVQKGKLEQINSDGRILFGKKN